MRQAIEPVSKANLAAMGYDELKDLAKGQAAYRDRAATERGRANAEAAIAAVEAELAWRDRIKSIKCHWLTDDGTCRHTTVTDRFGHDHPCPRLGEGVCTKRQLEFASRLLKPAT